MSSSEFYVMTKSLNAFVERLRHSKQIAARGRRQDTKVDGLLIELRRCYEATGGCVAFRKNRERHRVLGPYPDFLRAIRLHVFQRKVLASDEAFIARARKSEFFIRRDKRRLSSEVNLLVKNMIFWCGREGTKQILEAMGALPDCPE
jgi:hypothetical protein